MTMRRWLAALVLLLAPGLAWGEGVVSAGGTGIAVPGLDGTIATDESLAYVEQLDSAILDHLVLFAFSADGGQSGSYSAAATAYSGNAVTFTTAAAHGMQVHDLVLIATSTGTTYDGKWQIVDVPSATSFTVSGLPFTATGTGTWTHVTGGRCPRDLPQGNDDTGNGSFDKPFRSLGRAYYLALRGGVNIGLDGCDTWDVNDGGGNGDNESPNYLLGTGERMQFDSRSTGSHWRFCESNRRACVAFTNLWGNSQWRYVVSMAAYDSGLVNPAVFSLDADAADHRWLLVENGDWGTPALPIPGVCTTASDFYRANTSPGKVMFKNLRVYMCGEGNSTSPNNEGWTSHNTEFDPDFAVSVNSEWIYPELGTDGNSPAWFNLGSSAVIILGDRFQFENVNAINTANYALRLTSPAGDGTDANQYGFVYNAQCDFTGMDADTLSSKTCFGVGPSAGGSDAGTRQRLVVARSRCTGGGTGAVNGNGCFTIFNQNQTAPQVELIGFRNSSWDLDAHFVMGSQNVGLNLLTRFWCSAHYAGGNGANTFVNNSSGTSNCAGWTLEVDDFLVEEASSVVGVVESQTFATIAAFLAADTTRSCAPWPASNTMTDLTSDPFELETQTGLLRTAQAQGTCGHNLNEPFLFGLYIPRDLVNGVDEIHGVALHGVGESIGP